MINDRLERTLIQFAVGMDVASNFLEMWKLCPYSIICNCSHGVSDLTSGLAIVPFGQMDKSKALSSGKGSAVRLLLSTCSPVIVPPYLSLTSSTSPKMSLKQHIYTNDFYAVQEISSEEIIGLIQRTFAATG